MAQQTINTGAAIGDVSADPNRTAWTKANSNFDELYLSLSAIGDLVNVENVAGFDAAALQTALQTALNANSVVVVPAGSYTITAQVTIPSNTMLWIAPGATVAIGHDGVGFVNSDTVNGNTGCVIRLDGQINGNVTARSEVNTHRAIRFLRAHQSHIVGRGRLYDCMGTAVELHSSVGSTIQGIRIDGHTDVFCNGISFQFCQNCTLQDLVIQDCAATNAGSGYGIYSAGILNTLLDTHYDNSLIRCRVNGSTNDNLVLFDQTGTFISHCNFDRSIGEKACHASNAKRCYIEYTSFSRNAQAGLLMGATGGIAGEPNHLYRCDFSYNAGGYDGFQCNQSLVKIEECTFHRNNGRGFRSVSGTPKCLHILRCVFSDSSTVAANLPGMSLISTSESIVEECRFYDTQATKTQTYGIVEEASCSYNLFRNNFFGVHEIDYTLLLGTGSVYEANNIELGAATP